MPGSCPNNRCDFFRWDLGAPCLACGHRTIGRAARLVAAGVAVGVALAWLAATRIGGLWSLLLWLPVAVAVAALILVERSRPRRATPATLDERYACAVTSSETWLGRWTELFELHANVGDDDYSNDERMLLGEAMDAAADMAASALGRRHAIGAQYVDNGLSRLTHLELQQAIDPPLTHRQQWRAAVMIVERYLESLWLDRDYVVDVRKQLEDCRAIERRADLAIQSAAISRFETDGNDGVGFASLPIGPDPIEGQLRRLRIERALAADDPFAD